MSAFFLFFICCFALLTQIASWKFSPALKLNFRPKQVKSLLLGPIVALGFIQPSHAFGPVEVPITITSYKQACAFDIFSIR